ncbi:MAG: glycosyltransferase [Bacteroidales bacterium]|nr:glycosyltransferase [Bacteroidales bacterium]
MRNSISTGNKSRDSHPLPFLYIALPVMNEPELLTRTLVCIGAQTYRRFKVYICVNQPEGWWKDPSKKPVCDNNHQTLDMLRSVKGFDMEVLDYSSIGKGWKGKRHGIGQARKVLMDEITKLAGPEDYIISMDADTTFTEDYFLSIANNFNEHPEAVALSVPYFHLRVEDEKATRAILRYEIYMRHYFLNLGRIGSPFAFTALGSAMAFPVWAYRATGGMAPKLSGEDFYFLQKLRKFGNLLLWNDVIVYPEARFSDRVFFGTGPAMIKGGAGDWSSYPVYPISLFNDLLETYLLLPLFYFETLENNVVRFLKEVTKEKDPFQLLRENHKDLEHFTRAFHEKLDGLRILQFLKTMNSDTGITDEVNLRHFFMTYYPEAEARLSISWDHFSFQNATLLDLEKIRSFLFEKEMEFRFNSVFP